MQSGWGDSYLVRPDGVKMTPDECKMQAGRGDSHLVGPVEVSIQSGWG